MNRLGRFLIAFATALLCSTHAASARPPKCSPPPPPSSTTTSGGVSAAPFPRTLSGTVVHRAGTTTSWLLYPGACVQRALGTWSPKSNPVADSLQPTPGFSDSNFPNPFASMTTALGGANNDLTFTSNQPGAGSNSTNIRYVDPGTSNQTVSASVDGCPSACTQNIRVSLATDSTGAITSTAAQVATAIGSNADASYLVRVTDAVGNDGTGVVTAMAATFLSGGVNPVRGNYLDNQPDIPLGNNQIAYARSDQTLNAKLWHVVDSSTPTAQRPAIINGSRSLWCGSFDSNSAVKVGYPNVTFQILYFDTGMHSGSYNFSFQGNLSSEQN